MFINYAVPSVLTVVDNPVMLIKSYSSILKQIKTGCKMWDMQSVTFPTKFSSSLAQGATCSYGSGSENLVMMV
jgi:hypothetical protein